VPATTVCADAKSETSPACQWGMWHGTRACTIDGTHPTRHQRCMQLLRLHSARLFTLLHKACVALVALIAATTAQAAEFRVAGLVPTAFGDHRMIEMTGPVEDGDVERLQAALGQIERPRFEGSGTLISMDSPGGSFQAALELAEFIQRAQITTRIGPGQQCLSGCALAFMAGTIASESTVSVPRRILDRQGILGFHAPFAGIEVDGIAPDLAVLLLQDLDRNANVNAAAIVNLVAKGILPASLAEALMLHDKSTFRYIDTLYDLGRWNIALAGQEAVGTGQSLRPEDLAGAFCVNEMHWKRDVDFDDRVDRPDDFSPMNLEEFCNTTIENDAVVYIYRNDTVQEQGPVLYWRTLDPATRLSDMTPDDVTGAAIYRSPFDRRNEPPSQVEGACLAGYQWIGGWSGFVWSESIAHASYRSCDPHPDAPRIGFSCRHGDRFVEFIIVSSALSALDLSGPDPISIDGEWVVTPLGDRVQRNGAEMYVGEIGRAHPLFEIMKTGQVLAMQLGGTEMSLHLKDAKLAIETFQASCL